MEPPSPSHLISTSRKPTVDEKNVSSSKKTNLDETTNSFSKSISKSAKNAKNQSIISDKSNDTNSKMSKSSLKINQSKKNIASLGLNRNNEKREKNSEDNNIFQNFEMNSSSLQLKLEKEIKLRKSAEEEVVILKEKINFLKKEIGEREVENKIDFFNKNQLDKFERSKNDRGEDYLPMRNVKMKTQQRIKDQENITLDSNYEGLLQDNNNFYSPKNKKISNDIDDNFKSKIFLTKSIQPKHLKRNNLNCLKNNQANSLQSLVESQESFSVEEKNNANEMEVLYENFKNIKINNNNNNVLNLSAIDAENRSEFTEILKKMDGVLNFEEFKNVMEGIKDEHKKCGNNCIHLTRFYNKLGYYPTNKRPIYQLHKNTISKLPKIKSYKLVS